MPRKPQTKQERLAAALRANLKRRKAGQALARTPAKPLPATALETGPNNAKKSD